MSDLIKRAFLLSAFGFAATWITTSNLAAEEHSFYKPFNFKAFEARKRGYKIVVPKIAETISSIEYLKAAPSWPGYLRFPNPDNQSVAHAQAGFDWATYCFDQNSELKNIANIILGTENPTLADISLIARLHLYSLNDWTSSSKPTTTEQKKEWSWVARSTANATSADPELADFPDTDPTSSGAVLASHFLAYKRYLAFLATETFAFETKMYQPSLILNYQTALLEHKMTLGIEVPIYYKVQRMKMTKELSTQENQILAGGATTSASATSSTAILPGAAWPKIGDRLQDSFPNAYPLGLKDFYDELLSQKDLSTNPKAAKFGIGDISFIVNRRLESDYWNLGLIGICLTIPSAEPTSKKFIWPIELGNGGFWAARLHGALFWKYSNLVNPHLLGEVYFCFPSSVERRVSSLITYDASNTHANIDAENLPLGKTLVYDYKSFVGEPECKIPALAAGPTQYVEVSKGSNFLLRVGNVFDQTFFGNGTLDLYYQFNYKFSDSLSLKNENGLLDLTGLTKHTESWAQTLAACYTYHWKDTVAFELKGSTVFSGHNVLRNSSISLAMQMRF